MKWLFCRKATLSETPETTCLSDRKKVIPERCIKFLAIIMDVDPNAVCHFSGKPSTTRLSKANQRSPPEGAKGNVSLYYADMGSFHHHTMPG